MQIPNVSSESNASEVKHHLKNKLSTKKRKDSKSQSLKGKNRHSQKQQKKSNNGKKNSHKKSPKKQQPHKKIIEHELTLEEQGRYVALDCEFVGVGPGGFESALARVSIVDYDNVVLLDTFVNVIEDVTDYRTFVSGITEENLKSDSVMDSDMCISLVKRLLHNKILVGHGLKNDLAVLGIEHPWYNTRDTAKYEPFMKKQKKNTMSTLPRPRKLKDLAFTKLNREIQKDGEPHCSVEDAIAALDLYKKARTKWENAMAYKIDRTRQIEFLDMIESEQAEE